MRPLLPPLNGGRGDPPPIGGSDPALPKLIWCQLWARTLEPSRGVVLYLECQAANLQGRPAGQMGPTQRPSLGLMPSQAPNPALPI